MATSKITKGLTSEQFRRLPRHEQRILVAKDVLNLIKRQKISPSTGVYFSDTSATCNLNDFFLSEEKWVCRACAIGTCMVSLANIRNNMNLRDLSDSDGKSKKYLEETFTIEQRIMLETAFEGYIRGESKDLFQSLPKKTQLRLLPYLASLVHENGGRDSTDKLKRIMRNIIRNNGEIKVRPMTMTNEVRKTFIENGLAAQAISSIIYDSIYK